MFDASSAIGRSLARTASFVLLLCAVPSVSRSDNGAIDFDAGATGEWQRPDSTLLKVTVLVIGVGRGVPTDLEVSAMGGQVEGGASWSVVGDGGLIGHHFAVRMPTRAGEVSVVGRIRLGDQVREMESVLHVKPRGNLANGGCSSEVVREEVLRGGQRFRLDLPAKVPIPFAMRVTRAGIEHRGARASIIGRPVMHLGHAPRVPIDAIVCVDSLGGVTQVTKMGDVPDSLWSRALPLLGSCKYAPAYIYGRRVADWIPAHVEIGR